jgi:steroid delta-isomerase-like uncharacterized protein
MLFGNKNKDLARRFVEEVINKHNAAACDQLLAKDYKDHTPPPGVPPTLEGMKQAFGMFFTAFPDMHFHIEDIIAEGDKVVVRGTGHGTHKGEFMGIPPTGKQFSTPEIHICRYANGKMTEHWGAEDSLGMLIQLGIVPPPGQPAKK